MTIFRILLGLFLLILCAYTLVVVLEYGINLFPYFFGDMVDMTWAGQFNLDFVGFLFLSAFWTAWRNEFTTQGLMLAIVAFFGGMVFLTIYLLYLSFETDGDVEKMILGKREGAQ